MTPTPILIDIHVTHRDIVQGRANIASQQMAVMAGCPVAVSLRRLWHPEARAGNTHCYTSTVSTKFPVEAIMWLSRFDGGRPVNPFSFSIPAHPDYPNGVVVAAPSVTTPEFSQGLDPGDESEYVPGL